MLVHWCFLLCTALCSLLPVIVKVQSSADACKTFSQNDQCLECKAGWALHHSTCVDIDECGTELGQCPPNTYCLNTEGSFNCRGCDPACEGCMGSGPARCKRCASGYSREGAKCLDIDECSERVLACSGLDEICTNVEGSFRCDCANGFAREDNTCVKKQKPSEHEKGLFDDMKEEEVEVLQQMFFGVVLCALATLAAKGDMVFTSIFMGAVAAMAGYWLSDRGDRLMHKFINGH